MITKEKIKKEIDKMPNELMEKVYKYINGLKSKESKKKEIHTFNLKGQFDNINFRERAYE